MSETKVTFRDFASAIMQGRVEAAAAHLQPLLGLDSNDAGTAAAHFKAEMDSAGADFMMKAMGLRTVVTDGSDDEMSTLLGELFGLEGALLTTSVATLRAAYT